MEFCNPILSGFYPDPSICEAEGKYYLVNSTFAYFPGIPVFESTDMVHWKQIGNVIDRPEQLDLNGLETSQGVFAPTIRYWNGTFYVINTNVPKQGNFFVTAKDPRGPWSDPVFLKNCPGIDPSLFFDTDGKCYYIGTRENSLGSRYYGDNEIWLRELDLKTGELIGEDSVLWNSALKDAVWPEGPHVYHIGEWYYVMIAEGGTGDDHAITIARSRNLRGPYEGCRKNPIITHRHLGGKFPIVYVGHGDLVQYKDGSWYMILLASRPCEGYIGLGRETFLAKVEWEDEWPVVNPGLGRLAMEGDPGILPQKYSHSYEEDFAAGVIPLDMMTLRTPVDGFIYGGINRSGFLSFHNKRLRIHCKKETLSERENGAYLAIRQKSYHYQTELCLKLQPDQAEDSAGIAVLQNQDNYLAVAVSAINKISHEMAVKVIKHCKGKSELLAQAAITMSEEDKITIFLEQKAQKLSIRYETAGNTGMLQKDMDTSYLSTNCAGGFVGNTIGIYASGQGQPSEGTAEIYRFHYTDL